LLPLTPSRRTYSSIMLHMHAVRSQKYYNLLTGLFDVKWLSEWYNPHNTAAA
jgi:hypothetical protein